MTAMFTKRPTGPRPVDLAGVFLGFCTAGSLALAQNVPDGGALLRENQRQPPLSDTPRPARPPVTAPVDELKNRHAHLGIWGSPCRR